MDLPCVWDAPRPFIHPLTTPAGAVLSVEAPADHPWHHALWFTIKFVNGENFWEEYDEFGTLRTVDVQDTDHSVTATLEWIAPAGGAVRLRETRTISTTAIDADAYAIDWSERLTVASDTVLDRTPFTTWGGYGGLTLRGAPTWTDTVIRLDDGIERDRTLGEPSSWFAIDGLVGETTAGVAMFDHPGNLRSPSPWYASTRADTYGDGWANFVNAAFLWDEAYTLGAGEHLDLRYRVIVHDREWSSERIRSAYTGWAQ
jgi:hypothetical protein